MFYALEGTNTVLMGTMHMVPRGQDRWQADARKASEWAEQLVFEMHLDKARQLCEMKTGHGPLPDDFMQLIAERWPTAALGPVHECNFPAAWIMGCSQGLDLAPGTEAAIVEWRGGTEGIAELERPEEFISAFADVPAEDFAASISWRFKEKALVKQRFEQTYRAWRGHDVSKLLKITAANLHPSIRRAMFDVRNEAWAPKVAEFASSSKRTAVLVGAGHLCGPGSLLELLLRDYGLKASRTTL